MRSILKLSLNAGKNSNGAKKASAYRPQTGEKPLKRLGNTGLRSTRLKPGDSEPKRLRIPAPEERNVSGLVKPTQISIHP
jgi:hypothetical protein